MVRSVVQSSQWAFFIACVIPRDRDLDRDRRFTRAPKGRCATTRHWHQTVIFDFRLQAGSGISLSLSMLIFSSCSGGVVTFRTFVHRPSLPLGSLRILQKVNTSYSSAARHDALLRRLTTTRVARQESADRPAQESSTRAVSAQPRQTFLRRFIPSSSDASKSASSFRAIVALAKPEKKPLGIAVGLLLISSSVSMSIPLTVGKLIDYFTTPTPVSTVLLPLEASLMMLRSKYL